MWGHFSTSLLSEKGNADAALMLNMRARALPARDGNGAVQARRCLGIA
jgi:hypothetical protein